jgi:dUTP pyrophosphatase
MKVKIKKLHPDAVVPKYATEGSAGFDLVALENVIIYQGETLLIKTGLSVEIPMGYELQIRPRSGTSLKTPLRVANSPGTVDSDYRGEICVIMTNTDPLVPGYATERFFILKGERIAQGVICPIVQAEFEVVEELSSTDRGAGGFGSTGKT